LLRQAGVRFRVLRPADEEAELKARLRAEGASAEHKAFGRLEEPHH